MNHGKFTVSDISYISVFTALIAVGAFIRIPTPLVPVTLQCMFVMLAGSILGASRGAASVGAYAALGLIGIPIFTEGGGIGYVLKPTFGYIIGFIIAAFLIGKIARGGKQITFFRLMAANLAGIAVIYFIGTIYFALISNVYLGREIPLKTLLISCALLPLPGDVITGAAAALLSKRLIPILNKEKLIKV